MTTREEKLVAWCNLTRELLRTEDRDVIALTDSEPDGAPVLLILATSNRTLAAKLEAFLHGDFYRGKGATMTVIDAVVESSKGGGP
jgi:hypothetical protein